MTSVTRQHHTGNTNTTIKTSNLNQARGTSLHPCVLDVTWNYVILHQTNLFTTYLRVSVGKMGCSLWKCFPMFSISRRLLLYWMHLLPMVRLRLCVCIFKAPKQFSSDALSSRLLFASATTMAASAPDVSQGFGLSVLGFF